jgi:hypothetical protein
MRAVVGLGGLLLLGACGGGGTTGTNYSEPPPVAEIVATPSPKASESPAVDASVEGDEAVPANDAAEVANESIDANAL